MEKRLYNLDILKFIGLMCIILAHVNPPGVLFQIRNFDVVLMILISSSLYFYSTKKIIFADYLKKRFIRLVIPTWTFLTIFFILNYIFGFNEYNLKVIISSYILKDGIGFVWIIRIYLFVSILLPLYRYFLEKFKLKKIYIGSILLYLIYEIFCFFGFFNNSMMQYFFAYIIPCLLLITISYWIINADNKKIFYFSIISLIITIIIGILIYIKTGEIKQTQIMKYPFRVYYLSYSLFVYSILILIFRNKKYIDLCYNKFIGFVSLNSLWIYLWHILFLQIFKYEFWLLNYILVIICSIITTYVQSKIIEYLNRKGVNKTILRIFEG